MVKIKKFFLKLFSPFANEVWWPMWSNLRWKKAEREPKAGSNRRSENNSFPFEKLPLI